MSEDKAIQALLEHLSFLSPEEKSALEDMSIGARIRWAMDFCNEVHPNTFSIRKLARKAKISPQALWQIMNDETRRPAAETLESIAEAMGLPITFVMIGRTYPCSEVLPLLEEWFPEEMLAFFRDSANSKYIKEGLNLARQAKELGVEPETIRKVGEILLFTAKKP